jgi:hypothetical protein
MFINISKCIPILEGFQIPFEKNEPLLYDNMHISQPSYNDIWPNEKKTWEVAYLTKLLTSHFRQEYN